MFCGAGALTSVFPFFCDCMLPLGHLVKDGLFSAWNTWLKLSSGLLHWGGERSRNYLKLLLEVIGFHCGRPPPLGSLACSQTTTIPALQRHLNQRPALRISLHVIKLILVCAILLKMLLLSKDPNTLGSWDAVHEEFTQGC